MASEPDEDLQAILRRATAKLSEKLAHPDAAKPAAPAPFRVVRSTDRDTKPDNGHRMAQLERWGVPYQVARLLVDGERAGRSMVDTEALRYIDEFLVEADAGRYNLCVLAGYVGTGKTVAGAHFLERARARHAGRAWRADEHPRFLHMAELMVMGLYEHEEERDRLRRASALVVDDTGVEYLDKSGVGLAVFDWIVNARYGAAGYTVFTTNLPRAEFKERYGARIVDRLREQAIWFDVGGQSMRRAADDDAEEGR